MSIHSHAGPRGVAALGLVALLAAACSGGDATPNPTATAPAAPADTTQATGQAGTGTADPCALVTAAEAQAAMGVPVATTKGKGDGGYHVCDYASADGRNDLAVAVYDHVADDKTAFDLAYSGQPVTRVGSYANFNAALKALWVWQNGTVISITVSTSDEGGATEAQVQAALTKVALAALARL